MAVPNRREKLAGLRHGDFRGLALDDLVALLADRESRVQDDGVTGHHAVEEMPHGRKVLLARGDAEIFLSQPVEVLAHVSGRNAGKLKAALLAPGEKPVHRAPVGYTGVLVADPAVEKLIGRENSGRASLPHDGRQGRKDFGRGDQSGRGIGWSGVREFGGLGQDASVTGRLAR